MLLLYPPVYSRPIVLHHDLEEKFFSFLIPLIFSITTTIFFNALQYYFTAVLISHSYLVNSIKPNIYNL